MKKIISVLLILNVNAVFAASINNSDRYSEKPKIIKDPPLNMITKGDVKTYFLRELYLVDVSLDNCVDDKGCIPHYQAVIRIPLKSCADRVFSVASQLESDLQGNTKINIAALAVENKLRSKCNTINYYLERIDLGTDPITIDNVIVNNIANK